MARVRVSGGIYAHFPTAAAAAAAFILTHLAAESLCRPTFHFLPSFNPLVGTVGFPTDSGHELMRRRTSDGMGREFDVKLFCLSSKLRLFSSSLYTMVQSITVGFDQCFFASCYSRILLAWTV